MRRTRAIGVATGAVVAALAVTGVVSSYGVEDTVRGTQGQDPRRHGQADPGADRRADRPEPLEPRQRGERPPVSEPAPLLAFGDTGPAVRELQARLRQVAWFVGNVTDYYGEQTRAAVAGFQVKRGFPSTGAVDRRTLTRLEEMTTEPTSDELANVAPDPADGAPLDPRCTTGRVLCIDKTSSSLRWVVDGVVEVTLDARFGGDGYFTREGSFTVYRKSRDHVSSLYDTAMPFALFFSGGEAVHYSPDFAATGYAGSSHGCVNLRDYEAASGLFDQVHLGDRVVVYWS